jgi:uncharacterized protein
MTHRLDVTDTPECVECGACCFSSEEDYLLVAGFDLARLAEDAERLTVSIAHRFYMKITDGRCAALALDREKGQWLCSVYERRPDVCRWLQRGSGHCLAQRREKLERPIALRRKDSQS